MPFRLPPSPMVFFSNFLLRTPVRLSRGVLPLFARCFIVMYFGYCSPTAATDVLLCHMENATHVRPPPIVLKYSVSVRARPRVFLNNFRTLINGQWPWLEKTKRKNAYILRRGHTNYVFRPDKSIWSRLSCTSVARVVICTFCVLKKKKILYGFLNWPISPPTPRKVKFRVVLTEVVWTNPCAR